MELYRKTVLSNGVRLVTEQIPTVRSIALGIWVNVGGRHENAQNQGISHLLEHMIFKGTESRSYLDIALAIESVGGQINAGTGKELTSFYVQILDENVDIAVEVLSDILTNSLFLEEELTKEKSVIIEEICNLEDTPDELIFDYFLRELFPGHPLGLSILGTRETVSSFEPDGLRNFIRNKYTSDKAVITVAGNLEHEKILELVEEAFKFPILTADTGEDVVPPIPSGRKIFHRKNFQAHTITGTRSFKYSDPKKYAFFVLSTILGGGMSSRLFQTIREKHGLAYSVFTFNESLIDTGYWGVYIGADRNRIDDALDLAHGEFEKFRQTKIDDDELKRIKNQLKGNLMLGLESTLSRMYRLAKLEIYLNDFISLDDIINKINQVTAEQVMEVAEELLQPRNLLTVIFTPSEAKE